MSEAPPLLHPRAPQIHQNPHRFQDMPPGQADQALIFELQQRESSNPALVQNAAGAFALLQMMEGMLAAPQPVPTILPLKAAEARQAPAVQYQSPQQHSAPQPQPTQPQGGMGQAPQSTDPLQAMLDAVHKKNADLRNLISNKRPSQQQQYQQQMIAEQRKNFLQTLNNEQALNGGAFF